MLDNLNVRQKGALIVGVPAALQLIFALALLVGVLYSQYLLAVVHFSEEHMPDTIQYHHLRMLAIDHTLVYLGTGNPAHKRKVEEVDEKSAELLRQFASACDTVQRRELFTEIEALHAESYAELHNLMDQRQTAMTALLNYKQSVGGVLRQIPVNFQLLLALNQLSGQHDEQMQAIATDLKQVQKLIGQLLVCNCLTALLIATTIAFFLYKSFAMRLSVVLDNTGRVARGQAINPPVPGNDEVAALDSSVHSMVKSLAAAEAFRSDITRIIGNDLRAPLKSFSAFLQELSDRQHGELTELGKKRLPGILSAITSLAALIDDLMAATCLKASKLEIRRQPIELRDLLETTIASVQELASQRKIIVRTDLGEDTIIWADPARLLQVLSNLITNALKFSPEGSTITISATKDGDSCRVSVSDQGQGVGDEVKELIFGRFDQAGGSTPAMIKGSGLGLSIARSIVEAHGGKIGVDKAATGGACFWFILPSADSAEPPAV